MKTTENPTNRARFRTNGPVHAIGTSYGIRKRTFYFTVCCDMREYEAHDTLLKFTADPVTCKNCLMEMAK